MFCVAPGRGEVVQWEVDSLPAVFPSALDEMDVRVWDDGQIPGNVAA